MTVLSDKSNAISKHAVLLLLFFSKEYQVIHITTRCLIALEVHGILVYSFRYRGTT